MPPPMRTVIWDSTMFGSFEMCAYQFDLRFNKNLVPTETNEAIEEGDLVHKILEPYYIRIKEGKSPNDASKEALQIGQAYAAHDLDLAGDDAQEIFETFEEYVMYYGGEHFRIIDVERSFALEVYKNEEEGLRVIYTGKIDLLITDSNNPIEVLDHKKRRQNRKIDIFSNQFIGYCIATNTDSMTVNSFGLQKTLPPHEKFKRIKINYSTWQKEEWKQNMIRWARLYVAYSDMNIWPTNWTSCDKFSGCAYRGICRALSAESRENNMIRLYKTAEPWDVTAHLRRKKD